MDNMVPVFCECGKGHCPTKFAAVWLQDHPDYAPTWSDVRGFGCGDIPEQLRELFIAVISAHLAGWTSSDVMAEARRVGTVDQDHVRQLCQVLDILQQAAREFFTVRVDILPEGFGFAKEMSGRWMPDGAPVGLYQHRLAAVDHADMAADFDRLYAAAVRPAEKPRDCGCGQGANCGRSAPDEAIKTPPVTLESIREALSNVCPSVSAEIERNIRGGYRPRMWTFVDEISAYDPKMFHGIKMPESAKVWTASLGGGGWAQRPWLFRSVANGDLFGEPVPREMAGVPAAYRHLPFPDESTHPEAFRENVLSYVVAAGLGVTKKLRRARKKAAAANRHADKLWSMIKAERKAFFTGHKALEKDLTGARANLVEAGAKIAGLKVTIDDKNARLNAWFESSEKKASEIQVLKAELRGLREQLVRCISCQTHEEIVSGLKFEIADKEVTIKSWIGHGEEQAARIHSLGVELRSLREQSVDSISRQTHEEIVAGLLSEFWVAKQGAADQHESSKDYISRLEKEVDEWRERYDRSVAVKGVFEAVEQPPESELVEALRSASVSLEQQLEEEKGKRAKAINHGNALRVANANLAAALERANAEKAAMLEQLEQAKKAE